MFNKIKRTILRWANPTDYVSKQYYSNLPGRPRLSKCYKMMTTGEEPTYFTKQPIHFHGVLLSSPGKSYRSTFGKPHYKMKRNYNNSLFCSMVFKQQFCGLTVTSFVNLLDDDMVTSVYNFDISDKPTIRKIKDAIRLKYDIIQSELPDYFVIADPLGGRLVFDCLLNTTVTYFSVNESLCEKIETTLKSCENTRQVQGKLRQEEFAFAF